MGYRGIIKLSVGQKILLGLLAVVVIALVFKAFQGQNLEKTYHWTREASNSVAQPAASTPFPAQEEILSILKSVDDPELKVSIIDLGLIYEVEVEKQGVELTMTLTTPTCPVASLIIGDVKEALFSNPNVRDVYLRLTFDPPWTVERLSPEAQKRLMGGITPTYQKVHEKGTL
ncbi:MAG: metal-sulfur cluster assembly factor [Deltaproteobacteria bacterium]|nr:metal-sulfur cluster assembly factor [Deltaproteobacteria bacterium]